MNILENQQLAESVDGTYIDLEAQILQNIARHLQGWEQPIDTDRWLLQKLAEIGKLNQENIWLIAKMSGLSQTAAERMLNDAAQDAINNMEPGLRYMARCGLAGEAVSADKSKNVKRAVNGFHKQAKDTLNMCNTNMLYKASEKYRGLAQNIAREAWNILNSGAGGVVSGVEARQQAVRRCIRQLNDKGIPAFVDKRGREWTPEAYVNMAMRNTARSTAEEVQDARIRDAGCNLIQIDSHSGARPKCAKDQGKIFDLNNGSGYTEDLHGKKIQYYPWKSSSYGEPDGILGINCRHHKWPFIPGVNVQRYFPTEDMDANDKLYKQTQVQRALEREVRKQKRECMMLDAAGDQEGFEEAAVKLKSKEAQLKDYVDKNSQLHRRRDRERVIGFDKTVSAKAVAANKHSIRIASEQSQYREYLQSLKDGKVTLRREQKKLLEQVPEVGNWTKLRKKQVSVKDLAALTASTGHEFAVFTGKSSKILIHGTSKSWHIPHDAWEIIKSNQYEWTAHSHPTMTKITVSPEDRETLKLFTWQEKSTIIDLKGNTKEFTASTQDWINEILGVVDYDKREKSNKYSWPDTD